ncbi:WD40 repeat domain-containing protein [Phototrophicus methaneseepsis]|uniref:WD40 repeat domain-containing protein n=1 Tax=Phototrophicus methaneseepsis TaxID=2710758 RepID=A0A7S8IE49_9CHLR|nr:WD40 repeat domain-containing protein [Phototrophicus methaneseepsis]QPC82049.1 WD40 repeat domain-containing protein [Phototrophicus methaneseepsis]
MNLYRGLSFVIVLIGLLSLNNIANAQYPPVNIIDFAEVQSLAWSPDGNYLVTGNLGGLVLWDGNALTLIKRIPLQSDFDPVVAPHVRSIAWSPDSDQLAVRLSYELGSHLQIIDIPSGNVFISGIDSGRSDGLDWSPDGSRLAVIFQRGLNEAIEIRFLDATTGQQLSSVDVASFGSLGRVSWSPDGSLIAANYAGRTETYLFVWDGNTGELYQQISTDGNIRDFDWNPSSTQIATSVVSTQNRDDRTLQLWDVSTGALANEYHLDLIGDIDWHPSENLIAAVRNVSETGAITIDMSTGEIVTESQGRLFPLDWKPDGSGFVTIDRSVPLFTTSGGITLPQHAITLGFGTYNNSSGAYPQDMLPGEQNIIVNLADIEQLEDTYLVVYTNPRNIVESMSITLNGETFIANEMPYSIPLPGVGSYTISATPYLEDNAQGEAGTPLTITFEIINTSQSAPTANAGTDQTTTAELSGSALVTLDGSDSSDSDGTIVDYVWTEDEVDLANRYLRRARIPDLGQ